jgi:hypothetical protein
MPRHLPSIEQKEALQAFANRFGKSWKTALMEKWYKGTDVNEPEGTMLREIRNLYGARWLSAYRGVKPIKELPLKRILNRMFS